MRIEDNTGAIIYEADQDEKDVMSEETAYKTIDLMRGATTWVRGPGGKIEQGTGVRMRIDRPDREYDNIPGNIEIAGKTGTTQGQLGWVVHGGCARLSYRGLGRC